MDWNEWLARFVETIKCNWKCMQMWESQGCVSILQCSGQRWRDGLQGYQSTQEESETRSVNQSVFTHRLKTGWPCLCQNHCCIKSSSIFFICSGAFDLKMPWDWHKTSFIPLNQGQWHHSRWMSTYSCYCIVSTLYIYIYMYIYYYMYVYICKCHNNIS